ncbi:MAG: hypothetical protein JWM10_5163 [Myxococcaceae bacterium]|nr:hypothetical protein [Myxococcaceae bacterium]
MPTKWFINLLTGDPAANTFTRGRSKNHGPRIPLVAKRSAGHRPSATRTVTWDVRSYPGTHDHHFYPTSLLLLGGPTAEDIEGKFTNALTPPPIGGMTYEVTARKSDGQGAANVTLAAQYLTWRRLYYTVNYMDDRCKRLFAAVEKDLQRVFAEVFIDLKCSRTVPVQAGTARPLVMTEPTGPGTLDEFHSGPNDRSPYQLRLLLLNDLASPAEVSVTWTVQPPPGPPAVPFVAPPTNVPTTRVSSATLKHFKLDSLAFREITAAVAPAADAIARSSDGEVRLTFGEGPAREALAVNRTVTVQAKVWGRAAPEDLQHSATPLTFVVKRANGDANRVTIGDVEAWLVGTDVHLRSAGPATVRDPPLEAATWKVGEAAAAALGAGRVRAIDGAECAVSLAELEGADAGLDSEAGVTLSCTLLRRADALLGPSLAHPVSVSLTQLTADVSNADAACTIADGVLRIRPKRIVVDPRADALHDVQVSVFGSVERMSNTLNDHDLVTWNADHSQMTIALASTHHPKLVAVRAALARGQSVELKALIISAESIGGGYVRGSNVVLLPCAAFGTNTDADVRARLFYSAVHEIGHALGLTRDAERPVRTALVRNDLHYLDAHGGAGPHCHHNAHTEASDRTTSKLIYVPNGPGGTCVMFHNYRPGVPPAFCPRCKEHLLRAPVKLPAPAPVLP